jgi:APA family basic amino acid/polyamine antiporter
VTTHKQFMRARLGVASAALLVVANTIGVGEFTTSGFALADLKSPGLVLAAWAIGGVAAMCGALSYGALERSSRPGAVARCPDWAWRC